MCFPLLFIFINPNWFDSRGSVFEPALPGWSAATVGHLPYASRSHSAAHSPLCLQQYCIYPSVSSLPATCVLSPSCSAWAVWTHWQRRLEALFDAISGNQILTLRGEKNIIKALPENISRIWTSDRNETEREKHNTQKEKTSTSTELFKRSLLLVYVRESRRQINFCYIKQSPTPSVKK